MADALIERELVLGLLIVGAGALIAMFPGPLAKMNEAFDAVGSTRSDVEPTRWRILLVRAVGVGLALAGIWFLVSVYSIAPGIGMTNFAVLTIAPGCRRRSRNLLGE